MTPTPAGWKPISSAPKDGTTVILGRDIGAFGFIRGYGYFAGTEGAFVSGWVSEGFFAPHGNLGLANPTHWMPLPAAPCQTCNDQGAVGNILNAEPCPDCSPASVAPGDAQAVAWMDPETLDVISAERKASWLSNYGIGGANKAARYTRALGDFRPAPAAGDAVDAARYRFLRRNTAPLRLAEQMGIPRKQVKRSDDPAARVDEMCDAALAAQPTTKGKT